jgi:catechol 2,3-dioxygenase-like lactoylglutathione lyase family enzyme
MTDTRGHERPLSESGGAHDARVTWPEETIPILRVADAAVALRWYERLGFVEEWTHRFEPGFPAFMSIRRGSPGTGVRIFLSEHRGDAVPNGLLFLRVSDVAPIAAEFDEEIRDSGARHEVKLADPDGNRVRIGALTGKTEPGYTYPAQRPLSED